MPASTVRFCAKRGYDVPDILRRHSFAKGNSEDLGPTFDRPFVEPLRPGLIALRKRKFRTTRIDTRGKPDRLREPHCTPYDRREAVTARPTNLRKTATGWIAQAPAKVNLRLEVLDRRADGFHELETLIAPINLCDTLEAALNAPGDCAIRLIVVKRRCLSQDSGDHHEMASAVPSDERNLIVRALRQLQLRLGESRGLSVTLHKRIPVQAGLGGGSSDAAAALRLGEQLWGKRLPAGELSSLAAELGSDVPVFLGRRAAICRGRGERIEPVNVPAGLPCVLLQPPFGLGAGEVFAELQLKEIEGLAKSGGKQSGGSVVYRLVEALRLGRLTDAGRLMMNHLQQPAARIANQKRENPLLGTENWLEKTARLFDELPVAAHQMSGSGSTYFGLCQTWRLARRVTAWLRQEQIGWVGLAGTC